MKKNTIILLFIILFCSQLHSESTRQEEVVRSTLGEAWELFSNDFVLWVLAGLLMLLVSVVSLGILAGPMTVGFIKLVETRRRGEAGSATDVFDGFSQFGASLIASILIGIGVVLTRSQPPYTSSKTLRYRNRSDDRAIPARSSAWAPVRTDTNTRSRIDFIPKAEVMPGYFVGSRYASTAPATAPQHVCPSTTTSFTVS